MEILNDAVNWLQTLDDLRTRLPELKEDLPFYEYDRDDYDFHYHKDALLSDITNDQKGLIELTPQEAVNRFGALSDFATTDKTLKELREVAKNSLLPYLKSTKKDFDHDLALEIVGAALTHAENYQKTLARERENLLKNLITPPNSL